MQQQQILQNIAKHIQLDEQEASYFLSLLHHKKISRKEVLLQEGQTCRSIYYVCSGALRAYYADKQGNSNIIMFAINDWWITDMYSFINRQPAMLNIDALMETEVLELNINDLEQLYITVPKFERFFRIIMQNSYIREQLRSIQNISLPAEERYLNFIKKYPMFVRLIPQKQIASYLGITPQFLSVIRKKLASS